MGLAATRFAEPLLLRIATSRMDFVPEILRPSVAAIRFSATPRIAAVAVVELPRGAAPTDARGLRRRGDGCGLLSSLSSVAPGSATSASREIRRGGRDDPRVLRRRGAEGIEAGDPRVLGRRGVVGAISSCSPFEASRRPGGARRTDGAAGDVGGGACVATAAPGSVGKAAQRGPPGARHCPGGFIFVVNNTGKSQNIMQNSHILD